MNFFFMASLSLLLFSGCSTKHNPNGSYERANIASEKAHQRLDKEF